MGKVRSLPVINTRDSDGVLTVYFPLNVRQLNSLAGGGQTGEKKEGESPKHAVAAREVFVNVGHILL